MLFVCFLLFGIFCLIRELYFVMCNSKFQIVNLFGIMYSLTYGILPAYFIYSYDNNLLSENFMNNHQYLFVWLLFAMLSYIVIQIIYYYKNSGTNQLRIIDVSQKDYKKFEICAILCFIIGVVSMLLWTNAHGGIYKFILSANAIRGGWDTTYNAFAFFKHPARIIKIATFFFQTLVLLNYKKSLNTLLFLISCIFSILFLLASDGRLPMALFFVTMLLLHYGLFENGKLTRKKLYTMLIVGLMALGLIQNMDKITYFIRTGYSLNE